MVDFSRSQVDAAGEQLREYMRDDSIDVRTHRPTVQALLRVGDWVEEHGRPLSTMTIALSLLMANRGFGSPGGRLKRMRAVILKLQRFPTMRLSQMEDLAGCRVTLPTQHEADSLLQAMIDGFADARLDDYVDAPKPGGYRAKHLVVPVLGRKTEIQVRTERQNRWADEVESAADRLGIPLKYAEGPPELVRYFEVAADMLAAEDHEQEPAEDVRNELEDLRARVLFYFQDPL